MRLHGAYDRRSSSSSGPSSATPQPAPRRRPASRSTNEATSFGSGASSARPSSLRARRPDYGHEPQPGLALLWLARGRDAAALGAVRRLLAETAEPVHRSGLLPAAVEVFLAGAAVDEADAVSTS